MSEGDNRARFGGTASSKGDAEIGPGVAKSNPVTKTRLSEDDFRATEYASANNKDVLPEHQERRDAMPHIHAGTNV